MVKFNFLFKVLYIGFVTFMIQFDVFAQSKSDYYNSPLPLEMGDKYISLISTFNSNKQEEKVPNTFISYSFSNASDSTPVSKTIYEFDAYNRTTQAFNFNWETEAKDWSRYRKNSYEYDEYGNLALSVTYQWDAIAQKWKGTYKSEKKYDTSGNVLSSYFYKWENVLNNWVGVSKVESSFSAQNQFTQKIAYTWNTDSNQWEESTKETFHYNQQNDLELYTLYNWLDEWVAIRKEEHNFDYTNNTSIQTVSIIDASFQNWVNDTKYEFKYDESSNVIEKIYYQWISYEWLSIEKEEASYNVHNQLMVKTEFKYQYVMGWIASLRTQYTYDQDQYNVEQLVETWNTEQQEWDNNQLYLIAFNENGRQINKEKYVWEKGEWVGASKLSQSYNSIGYLEYQGVYQWSNSTAVWSPNHKSYLFYSEDDILLSNDNPILQVTVFPNPVKDFLKIHASQQYGTLQFEMFDLKGNKIIQTNDKNEINVQEIPSGYYHYIITLDNSKIFKGKLIK
ncbi:T9SS type A sorting domain-containing protein [Flammeovirga sp. SJP92]|uniref:T9SS type A sorting domain-containing protein n=1 Tax=Flammeovirga sp. SJP92 TaxID=1775430 RepID=UPI0007893A32|nr:T9SS type A sorting domain-containing protein [Flammeovirga sp. SJP92]KXX71101.1 hypothetical protein AVL50_09720 [Flammeovirga sp. SJP92]